ncbi:MAG: hypothetical protein ACE5FN_10465 [Leptospirillia bacterium]
MIHRRAAPIGWALWGVLLILTALTGGCASTPKTMAAYTAVDDGSLLARHAPVFMVERPEKSYNRIGTPKARMDDSRVRVRIDPDTPAIYAETRDFTTERGSYRNLIYRVHFERVPFRPLPSYVSAGRNVGLLVLITLDSEDLPVLVTTVHSCGCYLAFLPTEHLPDDAYPSGWTPAPQRVWGERLPGRLSTPDAISDARPVLSLRHGTHRVMGAFMADPAALTAAPLAVALTPMASLTQLTLPEGGTVSLFEQSGRRRGYVQGAYKPLETLLVGWWAWDRYVGSDKAYAPADTLAVPFYTSLKPWAREASDMWPFARFLSYWGWRL